MNNLESGQDAWSGAAAHGFNKNAVTVVIVNDQDVVIAGTTGCNNKLASLIRMNLTGGWFEDSRETMMRTCVAGFAGWEQFVEELFGIPGDVGKRRGRWKFR